MANQCPSSGSLVSLYVYLPGCMLSKKVYFDSSVSSCCSCMPYPLDHHPILLLRPFDLTCFRDIFLNSFMDPLSHHSFTVSGPFKINGVPLRRVNQSYLVATSTKVEIAGCNVEKFDDKYFAKKVAKKKKKGEGEFFEAEKEVSFHRRISE